MQLQLPLATLDFSAHTKKGADHTINKLYLSREWQGQSDQLLTFGFLIAREHTGEAEQAPGDH